MHKGLICIDFAPWQKKSFFCPQKLESKAFFPTKQMEQNNQWAPFNMAIKEENLEIGPLCIIRFGGFSTWSVAIAFLWLFYGMCTFNHKTRNISLNLNNLTCEVFFSFSIFFKINQTHWNGIQPGNAVRNVIFLLCVHLSDLTNTISHSLWKVLFCLLHLFGLAKWIRHEVNSSQIMKNLHFLTYFFPCISFKTISLQVSNKLPFSLKEWGKHVKINKWDLLKYNWCNLHFWQLRQRPSLH